MTPVSTRFDHPRDLLLEQRPAARRYCELKIGSALGRFRVLQEIGRGGHGVVYRGLDTGLGLSSSGVLKILDLGVARFVPDATSRKPGLATTQVVVGTVPYMSPEQLRGLVSDVRSDIWSAGTVLFELATGQRAFGNLTTTSRLTRILNGIVPRPTQIRPEVPAALERVILKAL